MLKNKGIALIEVLVASAVIGICVSGAGVLTYSYLQLSQDNAQSTQAAWIVQDLIGRMKSNTRGAMDSNYVTGTPIGPNCPTAPTACANHTVSGGGVEPTACTAAQLAEFDMWNVVCGIDASTNDAAGEFMRSPSLTSTCSRNNAGICTQYTIGLTWIAANEQTQHQQYNAIVEIE